MRGAFSLVELLVATAVVAVLAVVALGAAPGLIGRADSADALAKIRWIGSAVLQYPADHNGMLPALFPGQVLEYEAGRGGRIVTECSDYLAIGTNRVKFLVSALMPRAYARLAEPKDKNAMRVYVMNTSITNNVMVINPFGRVTVAGQPPTGNVSLAALHLGPATWMMSTVDQRHPNVAGAPWKSSTPPEPPLGGKRALFRFDGAAEPVIIGAP